MKARIEDKKLHIVKHLQESSQCRQVSNFESFDVIDCDNPHFGLQLKEVIEITWKKSILNKEIKHHSNCICFTLLNYKTKF